MAVALALAVGISSCNSSSAAALDQACSINTDCNSPLICAFARCHQACRESRDCSSGERCVKSGASGVCQLPTESKCGASAMCQSGQVCGTDQQCRTQCSPSVTCSGTDICATIGTVSACYVISNSTDEIVLIGAGILASDGAVIADGSAGIGDASGSGSDAEGGASPSDATMATGGDAGDATMAASDGGQDASDGTGGLSEGAAVDASPGNSCPTGAQTQFGNIATGDSNSAFGGGTTLISAVFLQSFDLQTTANRGAAQPLFSLKNLVAPNHGDYCRSGTPVICTAGGVSSVAIAPTGQIALVGSAGFVNDAGGCGSQGGRCWAESMLYAAFLDAASDGGVSGLRVRNIVLLETASSRGSPRVIWSKASQAFVMSWWYQGSDNANHVKVAKFLADGRTAGGNSDVAPTDRPQGVINATGDQGSVGVSGNLFGVAYATGTGGYPALTVMDPVGIQVGTVATPAPSTASTSQARLGQWTHSL